MAEIILNIDVSGEGTIDDDFKAELNKIVTGTAEAMKEVQAAMVDSLQSHIEKDVYKRYRPKSYERRSENAGLGTPLNDMSKANVTHMGPGGGKTATGGISITAGIDYHPTGEHANENWNTVSNENELIGRIEHKNPPYFYKAQKQVPERPFWQNFVNEMVDGGEISRVLIMAMQAQGIEIEMGTDEVERESRDGDY